MNNRPYLLGGEFSKYNAAKSSLFWIDSSSISRAVILALMIADTIKLYWLYGLVWQWS